MDWGVANGTATVVALADGSASIYLSSGGGYLGGHAQESIRSAAQLAVKLAATAQNQMKPAGTDFPLPGQGQVILYVHSDAGLLTASVPQQDLQSNRYPLSQLANAMQNVITQYRLHQQGHGAPEQKVN